MPEDAKTVQRSKVISYALMILIFVGLTAVPFFQDEDGALQERLTFSSDGYLTLRDSGGWSEDIRYSSLTAVSFYGSFDFGEPLTGGISNGVREGLWRSEAFGEYIASADAALDCCVLLRTEKGVYAVNCESSAATKALADALVKAAGLS